ncbi:GA module-containing protein [Mycoplasmopsis glycophila]|uniref:ECM-binding protein homolog n=1 Tax=Mycoplasmopsis glycophila TaxID=171285 RepID=A0A449AVI7_9BACT|nr:GA module-containing protein [Mycoplasmopsis glycophila]VEU70535.1 ECM-binding protein homolog [Mycoplasmopsis glycophila]
MNKKKILLVGSGLVAPVALPLALLSASTTEAGTNDQVLANTPNLISYNSKAKFTFYNPTHYQYNFKDGTLKWNYYFNEGMPGIYANKDYSKATIKMKGEGSNKFENQEGWYEEEQEWEATFNRIPDLLKAEGWGANMWTNSPRFGLVISKSLEIVPNSMEITVYKTTKSEEVLTVVHPDYVTNDKSNLYFSHNDIVKDMPIPNSQGHDWKGDLTSFNRWTTWFWNGEINYKKEVREFFKDKVANYNRGVRADMQPIRASFLKNWRSELERKLEKIGNRHLYPPKSIVFNENNFYNTPIFNNIGTIFGFGYNTGAKPTGTHYDDQNWFKVTFKTRKNQAIFDANNAGDLAYVMAGYTTYDFNTDVYSFNWKAANINPDAVDYSIDVKETKQDPNVTHKLPSSVSFALKGFDIEHNQKITIPDSAIIVKDQNQTHQNVDSWYSRTFNALNKNSTVNQYLLDTFRNWKLEGTIANFDEDFWDLSYTSKLDPNESRRLIFNVSYTFNEFKYERIQAKNKIAEFTNLSPAQKALYEEKIKHTNNLDEFRALINLNDDNNGEIKDLDTTMGLLKDKVAEAHTFMESDIFTNSQDNKQKQAFVDLTNNANDLTKSNSNALSKAEAEALMENIDAQIKKFKVKNDIDSLKNLNDKQKEALKNEVDLISELDPNQVAKYDEIRDKARNLDEAMKSLKEALTEAEEAKNSTNYENSSADTKKAFDNALEALNNKKDENISLEKAIELTEKLNAAKDALNGDELLAAEKEKAKNEIDQLINLNAAQKEDLKNKVDEKTSINEIKDIILVNGDVKTGEAAELDRDMENLKKALEKAKEIKEDDQYNNSTEESKAKLDSAINEVEGALNNNLSSEEIKENINKLIEAINQLDGNEDDLNPNQNEEIKAKREEASNLIDELENLNDKQKEALKNEIKTAKDQDAIDSIIKKDSTDNSLSGSAKDLDDAMKKLEETLKKAKEKQTSTNSNYDKASNDKKTAFDDAIKQADSLIKSNTTAKEIIEKAKEALLEKEAALHGDRLLEEAKQKAKKQIDKLENLSQEQKDNFKNEIDTPTDVDQINKKVEEAKELDEALGKLKDKLENIEKIIDDQDPVFTESSKEQQDELKKKIDEIKEKLAKEDLTKEEVEELTKHLDELVINLDGIKKLETAKNDSINLINNLENLNILQKQSLKEEIKNATSKAQIEAIIKQDETNNTLTGSAKELDDEMAKLKELIKEAEDTKTTPNYSNSQNKATFDQALENAHKNEYKNLTKEQVQNLNNKLREGIDSLNGKKRLDEIFEELTNFVNSHRDVYETNLYNNSVEKVKRQFAQYFDKAKDVVDSNNNEGLSYDEMKALYDNLVATYKKLGKSEQQLDREEILNLPNLNKDEKDELIDEYNKNSDYKEEIINKAIEANKTKQEPIDKINNSPYLSEEDKKKLIDKVVNINVLNRPEDLDAFKEELNKIIEKAAQIVNDLVALAENYDANLADRIAREILEAMDLGLTSPLYQATLLNIQAKNDLLNALARFESSTVLTAEYRLAKAELVDLINRQYVSIFSDSLPALNTIINKQLSAINKGKEIGNLEMDLVNALIQRDQAKFSEIYNELKSQNYEDLTDLNSILNDLDYFNVDKIHDKFALPEANKDKLLGRDLYNGKQVFRSAVLINFQLNKDRLHPAIPISAALILLTIVTLGIYFFVYKKKKQNK